MRIRVRNEDGKEVRGGGEHKCGNAEYDSAVEEPDVEVVPA